MAFQTYQEVRLTWFGLAARGVVLGLQEVPRPCDQSRSRLAAGVNCTSYVVEFRYQAADRMRTSQAFASALVFAPLQVGGGVDLHYLAADPAVVSLDQGGAYYALIVFALMAVVMVVQGVLGLKRRARSVQLEDDGASA